MRLGIIGSGPTGIYLLKHLLGRAESLGIDGWRISIFEVSELMGVGMPWSPETAEKCHLANISAEELPKLPISMVDWLGEQDGDFFREYEIENVEIEGGVMYPRLVVGEYFRSQYDLLVKRLRECGCDVDERADVRVKDVREKGDSVEVSTLSGECEEFDKVLICSGHQWGNEDRPDEGFYASPWPIFKLLPQEGEFFDFEVGVLGASLSAFDVVTSLARRHGEFVGEGDEMRYEVDERAGDFGIVLHSMEGWLPHLQFEQRKARSKIYGYVKREDMDALVGDRGWFRLAEYFDEICRELLLEAACEDGAEDLVELLEDEGSTLLDLVEVRSAGHDYSDPFEGMREELKKAVVREREDEPTRWKEVLDDLLYCLNFHAEFLPMEDHLKLREGVMPFWLNVVAGLPLESARILLALHEAGRVRVVEGKVEILGAGDDGDETVVEVEKRRESYRLFVDCSGQGVVEVNKFPFRRLVEDGTVRAARAMYADKDEDGELGGIEVDRCYRVVGEGGCVSERVYDLSFPHTMGVRPYSYGLQSCHDSAEFVVGSW